MSKKSRYREAKYREERYTDISRNKHQAILIDLEEDAQSCGRYGAFLRNQVDPNLITLEEVIIRDKNFRIIKKYKNNNLTETEIEYLRRQNQTLCNKILKAVSLTQELKDHIDKSKFDGMTKAILILSLNEIQNCLGGNKNG